MDARPIQHLIVALVALALASAVAWLSFASAGDTAQREAGAAAVDGNRGNEVVGDRGDAAKPAHRVRTAVALGAAYGGVASICGRVLDADGGPLIDALVGEALAPNPTSTTGDGDFVVELVDAPGAEAGARVRSLTLLVLAAGHAPSVTEHTIEGQARHDVGAIRLLRGGGLRGRITDRTGNSLALASVTVTPATPPPWSRSLDGAALVSPAATDAAGDYAFAHLPPGGYRVTASAPLMLSARSNPVQVQDGVDTEVDPIVLVSGLQLTGTVVDAGSGRPVEEFAASIRRAGPLDPQEKGTTTQQLRRRIEALRADAARAADAEAHAQQIRIAAELEARVPRAIAEASTQSVAMPSDPGPVVARPQGKFAFDGLEEGAYAIWIVAPTYQVARVEPVEVRRGVPGVEVRVALVSGCMVRGKVVSKRDGAAVAGAKIELMRELPASREQDQDQRRSLYPWFFARSGPQGIAVLATRTTPPAASSSRRRFPAAAS